MTPGELLFDIALVLAIGAVFVWLLARKDRQ